MEKELTDEEKKIAEKLFKEIKSEIQSSITDESVGELVKAIVKLSKEGLTEEEITKQLREDPPTTVGSLSGAVAIGRMEKQMMEPAH